MVEATTVILLIRELKKTKKQKNKKTKKQKNKKKKAGRSTQSTAGTAVLCTQNEKVKGAK